MAEAGSDDDNRPVAGFFGKLPTVGDFVERGLPPAFRRSWDRWLTSHIAPRLRGDTPFPPLGQRFRLVSGGVTAAGLILPSRDSAGRVFPISLLLIAEGGLTNGGVDQWCDRALALFDPAMEPDALWAALDALAAPEVAADAGAPCLLVWSEGSPAVEFVG